MYILEFNRDCNKCKLIPQFIGWDRDLGSGKIVRTRGWYLNIGSTTMQHIAYKSHADPLPFDSDQSMLNPKLVHICKIIILPEMMA